MDRVISALPKGTSFARLAIAMATAKGDFEAAALFADGHFRDTPAVAMVLRTAVTSGTTADANWAAPLVQYADIFSEFAAVLYPQTILGKLPVRPVPLDVRYPVGGTGTTMSWVQEAKPIPASKMSLTSNTLGFAKASGLCILTKELVRLASPDAVQLVSRELQASARAFFDANFIDPSVAAVANVSPASVTNGATKVVSTGITATAIGSDLATVLSTLTEANEDLDTTYFVMRSTTAVKLAAINGGSGPAFPDITARGGYLMGVPVICSNSVPGSVSGGQIIVAVSAGDIDVARGTATVDTSERASVQMESAPGAGAQSLVSLFQNNLIALRLTVFANWAKRRTTAVAYLDNLMV